MCRGRVGGFVIYVTYLFAAGDFVIVNLFVDILAFRVKGQTYQRGPLPSVCLCVCPRESRGEVPQSVVCASVECGDGSGGAGVCGFPEESETGTRNSQTEPSLCGEHG